MHTSSSRVIAHFEQFLFCSTLFKPHFGAFFPHSFHIKLIKSPIFGEFFWVKYFHLCVWLNRYLVWLACPIMNEKMQEKHVIRTTDLVLSFLIFLNKWEGNFKPYLCSAALVCLPRKVHCWNFNLQYSIVVNGHVDGAIDCGGSAVISVRHPISRFYCWTQTNCNFEHVERRKWVEKYPFSSKMLRI